MLLGDPPLCPIYPIRSHTCRHSLSGTVLGCFTSPTLNKSAGNRWKHVGGWCCTDQHGPAWTSESVSPCVRAVAIETSETSLVV